MCRSIAGYMNDNVGDRGCCEFLPTFLCSRMVSLEMQDQQSPLPNRKRKETALRRSILLDRAEDYTIHTQSRRVIGIFVVFEVFRRWLK